MQEETRRVKMDCKHVQNGTAEIAVTHDLGDGIDLNLCQGCKDGMRQEMQQTLTHLINRKLGEALAGDV
jgi:hypothetical protein